LTRPKLIREALPAAALFVLLTGIMLYPLSLDPAQRVLDLGDTLLNSWVLAWDLRALAQDPWNLFNAGIFFPHSNTLAFSEHMLALALLGWPVQALTGNPILVHNLLLLLSFVLSGLGTYLLVLALTGNRWAAAAAGIGFAFCPFRMVQRAHLQIESIQWLPFLLLAAHSFARSPRWTAAAAMTGLYLLQVLSCGYHALMVTVCLVPALVLLLAAEGNLGQGRAWGLLAVFGLVSALAAGPFFLPYFRLQEEMGFGRSLVEIGHYSADLIHYLAPPPVNRLWGPWLSHLGREELHLFLGLTPVLLLVAALWPARKPVQRGWPAAGRRLLLWRTAILLLAVLTIALAATGPWRLGGVEVKRIENLFLALVGLAALRLILDRGFRAGVWPADRRERFKRIYLLLLLACFLFSLGPGDILLGREKLLAGPYDLLLKFVPGFGGMRVPARFGMPAAFFLAVLAGLGLARLMASLKNVRAGKGIALVACGMLLVEFWSAPLELKEERPNALAGPLTAWLAGRPRPWPILELPLGRPYQEAGYVFASIFHGQPLVNGYSGFFPKDYLLLVELLKSPPRPDLIRYFSRLGVRALVVHDRAYGDPGELAGLNRALTELTGAGLLESGPAFGPERVFLLVPGPGDPSRPPDRSRPGPVEGGAGPAGLVLRAHPRDEAAGRAGDGDPRTHWDAGRPQRPGDFLELDFGRLRRVGRVELTVGWNVLAYPRGLKVLGRDKEGGWFELPGAGGPVLDSSHLDLLRRHPKEPLRISLDLGGVKELAGLRLIQTGSDPIHPWAVAEVRVEEERKAGEPD